MPAEPPELTGYADPFSAASGERVALKLSCDADAIDVQLVELLHGDDDPRGPGFLEREVASNVDGRRAGRVQRADAGSYAIVEDAPALGGGSFALALWLWTLRPASGRAQALASRWSPARAAGWWLALGADGRPELRIGETPALRLAEPLRPRRWYRLAVSCDVAAGRALLACAAAAPAWGEQPLARAEGALPSGFANDAGGAFVLAGRPAPGGRVDDHFSGKLEAPALLGRPLAPGEEAIDPSAAAVPDGAIAAWDLGAEPGSRRLRDRGPHGLHGRVVQRPDRAMTGHAWDGSVTDPRAAPEQYGAIAFHEDDLEDAGWETDATLELPGDLPSGVYALRVRAGGAEDHVPFVVRAPRERATSDVALLIPTFSYMAYANDHVLRLHDEAWKYVGLPVRYDPLDEVVARHPEWGNSLYDTHADGSGVAISSRLRPIVNLRPRYRWWASGSSQYLASDLYTLHWLRTIDVGVDLITDEDLHREGRALLDRYRVVLTGTHPEYTTGAMLDALAAYRDGGGRLMYLGANGFYWVTSVPDGETHAIEVRRGNAGTRAWDSEPGEEHHALTGERGGLWRHRGRSPNALVGIGFAAQGWSDPSPGYRRTAASYDPAVAWIFDGVEAEVIGDCGLAMNGAAGDELDRFDVALGSPEHAAVLASSEGHSRYYVVVHEDLLQTSAEVTGETNPNVRADLVYFEAPNGGAVFSVGSKSWCASLPWNGCDNDVARVSENVLRRFLA